MATPVQIIVNGLSGPWCEVEASTEWTILQVHGAIWEKINVPVDWQTLLKGTEKLSWEVKVQSLIPEDSRSSQQLLQLTLVVQEGPKPEPNALMSAILASNEERALRLLQWPQLPGLNAPDHSGSTVLHTAAAQGLIALCQAILARPDFDMNSKDRHGRTALHSAAARGHLAALRAILPLRGFEFNAKDGDGRTASQVAAQDRQRALATFLANAATVEAPGPGALRAAMEARQRAAAMRLIQHRRLPDLNAFDELGRTLLHLAIECRLPDVALAAVAREDFRVISAKDHSGWTALHRAAGRGFLEVCKAIVSRRDFAQVGARTGTGEIASQVAGRCGHRAVAEFLQDCEHFAEKGAVVFSYR